MDALAERKTCRDCGQTPFDEKFWLHGICTVCLRVHHEPEEALERHDQCDHAYLRTIFGQS